MFGTKKTKADLISAIIRSMSYAEMMIMGKQLYEAASVIGNSPITDDQFARIMYEWTLLEKNYKKKKSGSNGVVHHQLDTYG